jgi:hypothetical protein
MHLQGNAELRGALLQQVLSAMTTNGISAA